MTAQPMVEQVVAPGAPASFAEVLGAYRPARAAVQFPALHHGFRVAADAGA